MNDLLSNFTSLSWWIGVVIVGIVIHLVGSYLKKPVDKLLSRISSSMERKGLAHETVVQNRINNMVNNHHEQVLHVFGELRYRVQALFSLMVGGFILVIIILASGADSKEAISKPVPLPWGIVFVVFVSAIAIFLGLYFLRRADQYKIYFIEARYREAEKHK